MAQSRNDLIDQATAWRNDDPDPATREELTTLIAAAQVPGLDGDAAAADLADRFSGMLEFGTAGLRGALGAGPHRMNRAVVIRAAAGLAAYLNEVVPAGESPRIVVGYDARHNSDVFAADTCAVMAAAGITAMVLPRSLPTPVLAFAVRHLGCDAGVMVTASHNPPQDNGYKVYLGGRAEESQGNGVQIVPPADGRIAAHIADVAAVADVPRTTDGWATLGDELVADYLDAITAVPAPGARDLSIVLTPLHGVGGTIASNALRQAGFAAPHLVVKQAEPDPDFPTVAFPNPEEPGAIDLALAAAAERDTDLVIALDPDADRCAVAVRDPQVEPDGGWRMLTGDELGALLASHVLDRDDAVPADAGSRPTTACSIVSSQLLGKIAAAHGVQHRETLTGFKWIARTPGLIFGYEEAIGYCVAPRVVRDKDGISAALLIAEFAATLKAAGRTLLDELDDLALTHGLHTTGQLAIRVEDTALITAAMARLRAQPPRELAGQRVSLVEDLADGVELPPTDGLRYRTDDGLRVVVRPSGTEPKLKCYLETVVAVTDRGALPAARATATATLDRVRADLHVALGL